MDGRTAVRLDSARRKRFALAPRGSLTWFALLGAGWLSVGPAAAEPRRPRVDRQAMREAIQASQMDEEPFSSSASYAHFLRARLAHHDGDHRRAIDELRLALATDEGDPVLLTALAQEHAEISELGRAERELLRVIERHPGHQPAQLLLGRVLFEARKLTRARVHLARAIKLNPKDPEPYLVLAQYWLELNRPDEAARVVEELAAALPGEITGLKRLGAVLSERGDLARAERLLRRAVDQDPGDFEAWVNLAQVLEGAGRIVEAEEAFARAVEREPDHREVLLAAGRLALRLGADSRARAYFDRALATSEDPELAVRVAFAYLGARRLSSAAEVLDAARRLGGGEPRLSFYAGLVHERLRQYVKAAEAYAEVPPESELFSDARLHRAVCLSLAGQHRTALELFRRALGEVADPDEVYPEYARALERSGAPREAEQALARAIQARSSPELVEALAGLYRRQGRLAEAVKLLTEALASRPRDEVLLFALGAVYEQKGEHDRSIAQMRAVLEVDPEHAAAMNFIGYLLAERGHDLDEAERLVTRALELKPDTGEFLDSLGWVYFQRGEYHRAIETLERAATLVPGDPTISEHLGDAYSRAAEKTKAAQAYRQALEALRAAPELASSKRQGAAIERKLKLLSSELGRR